MGRVKEIKDKLTDAILEVIEEGDKMWSCTEYGVVVVSLSDNRGNIVKRKEGKGLVWFYINGVSVNRSLENDGFKSVENAFLNKVNHLRDKEFTDIVLNNTERALNSIINSPTDKKHSREMTKADWWQTARVVMLFICAVILAVMFVSS